LFVLSVETSKEEGVEEKEQKKFKKRSDFFYSGDTSGHRTRDTSGHHLPSEKK
jgi:hypothetical protein